MGPVYMGKIERTVTDFIKKFHDELLTKKLTIVIIAMNADGFKSMLKQNLSDEIREHAEIFHGGGAYYFERMTFFQKRIVQAVARVRTSSELILYENLDKIKI
jgi:menaquinone-dependent protoporphyrinogen IX oxidase